MNVQQSKFRLSRWAGATLALGLLLSGLGAWGLALVNEQQARMALEREAELLAEAVTRRVELYQYGLRGVRGALLTAGEAHIDRELFRRYSLTRDIDREFPGARGFGFIRRVAAADEAGFLRQARADGQPEFRIQQLTPHDGERYVIQYIEPVARNGQALGLDIASEANRREAARAALETGQVRLTGPITLVQASGLRQQSFLILMPIYRSGITPPPGPQRELEGFGWSYAPLLTGEVLAGLPIDNAAIHLELSDVTGDGAAVPFFVNGAAARLNACSATCCGGRSTVGTGRWRSAHCRCSSSACTSLRRASCSWPAAWSACCWRRWSTPAPRPPAPASGGGDPGAAGGDRRQFGGRHHRRRPRRRHQRLESRGRGVVRLPRGAGGRAAGGGPAGAAIQGERGTRHPRPHRP